MIHVLAFITAKPGKRTDILQVFLKNVPAVLAEEGCISYEAVVDVPDFGAVKTPTGPDSFVVVEKWASGDALKAHAASAHMVEYVKTVAPWLEKRVIHVLEAAE
jgi:quinol monooxygenase YgiN